MSCLDDLRSGHLRSRESFLLFLQCGDLVQMILNLLIKISNSFFLGSDSSFYHGLVLLFKLLFLL
jgi:hypothetical protein